ncbi:MAG: hypothetical protein C6I00_04250 [Nitratiruptor sp.]|nr:hypothetical protein [Nitratiruptor sp.]NPA83997.1 TonB C-terminal domain-containing protein [Campylobacterota bacterium]
MDSPPLKLLSLLFALILYGLLIWSLSLLGPRDEERIKMEGEPIEILLLEPQPRPTPPRPKVKPNPNPAPPKPKIQRNPPKKPKGSPTPKERSAPKIQDLFASLKGKYTTKPVAPRPKASIPSRKRAKNNVRKLLETLDLQVQPSGAKKRVEGVEDPYLRKVYRILYDHWHPSKMSGGHWAKVVITIRRDGTFSYRVLESSGDALFDRELESYLDYLTTRSFPRPKEARSFIVRFRAKE